LYCYFVFLEKKLKTAYIQLSGVEFDVSYKKELNCIVPMKRA